MSKDLTICRQVATETVAVVCDKLGKTNIDSALIMSLSEKFSIWIQAKGMTKDVLINRQAALRRAALFVNISNLDNTDKVLELANEFCDYYDGIWKRKS